MQNFTSTAMMTETVTLPAGVDGYNEVLINMPLYSGISDITITLEANALIAAPLPRDFDKPILFYGSSITQGGCASRPGNSYQAIISAWNNVDYVNLGFSGGAKAEDEIIAYIKDLPMSVFVYDYDHNAPTVEHLRNTHEKMFKAIRAAQPDLPILMLSRPKYYINEEEEQRLEIIKTTYQNAIHNGDKNVYFIPGKKLMELARDEGTVDGCHPTDLGFYSMAMAIEPVLKAILED